MSNVAPILLCGEISATSALTTFGNEISQALGADRLLSVLVRLVFLWLCLRLYEELISRAARWRLAIAHSMSAWAPTVRLTTGGLMMMVLIDAMTPEQPAARAIVAGGVVLAVLWSGQAVLRNAVAGAVIIARRAVKVGEHLEVGELSGEVLSVTLRGVELEAADGTRTFVPGLLLHTELTSHGPVGVRARAIQLTWRIPTHIEAKDHEELRGLAKRLTLLSARRAPGTPVLVHRASDDSLRITVTPYDRAESDALRLEITRRLAEAYEPHSENEIPAVSDSYLS